MENRIGEEKGNTVGKKRKGCLHTMLFKVICGVVAIFLLFAVYNLIVRTDNSPAAMMDQEEEEVQKALLDTFDVVGDYFFPNRKSDREDLITDEEREAAKKEKEKSDDETMETASSNDDAPAEDEIIESADISSDVRPAPAPEQKTAPAPTVEKVESPTITPIE